MDHHSQYEFASASFAYGYFEYQLLSLRNYLCVLPPHHDMKSYLHDMMGIIELKMVLAKALISKHMERIRDHSEQGYAA